MEKDDIVVEKYSYRGRENILIIDIGLKFLVKRKFELFMNVELSKEIILQALKYLVLEKKMR